MPHANPYAAAGAALIGALRRVAIDAPAAVEARVEDGARRMVAEPWRIIRAVYPHRLTAFEEVEIAAISDDCDRMLEGQREMVASGHWCGDRNRLIALRQARRALDRIIAAREAA